MLAPVTHILPLTTIRRERVMPTTGRVIVRTGQKVLASDVIAECHIHNIHLLLDTVRGLGVPAEAADELVVRKVGERVIKGDVIAGPVGVLNRVMRAPESGIIRAVGDGQVLLEIEGELFELQAGIPGTVVQLVPDRGAVIEVTGALVQGMWGNGKVDKSMMRVLAHAPDEELSASAIDVGLRGAVVLGGICTKAETLQAAIDVPLRGLILASMPARLIPLAQKAPFPILLLEGFGQISINPVAYTILTTNEQREVTVNAAAWDHQSGARPEVIIPLPASGDIPVPPETDIFAPGQTVRIHRAPSVGHAGTLANLRPGLTQFPSGVRIPAATVRLSDGEQTIVPLVNLDVIE